MLETYNLERFVRAQNPVFEEVCSELRAGRKTGHWMWFIFPQVSGLGHSDMSRAFAIHSREEAVAFLNHPVLGPRLYECTAIVNNLDSLDVRDIFGDIDAMKFRSCVTLFSLVASGVEAGKQPFIIALQKYFGGKPDQRTINLLKGESPVSPFGSKIS